MLSPWIDPETGKYKFYGRFNMGVVTLNLVDVACSSYGDEKKFWELLDERLELCHRALLCRYERLKGTKSDVAPILWQHGALARLKKDHNYITNSYHVVVREKVNAFDKLKFEAPFQALSTGGAISYVEVPNMQNNIDAVIAVMQYIYDNIMYAELNTKSDYCMKCGYDGEIKIIEEETSHKLIWECPCCGNRDQDQMSVARRTCGYIGTQFWNQGRTQEIKDRQLHL